jgi:enoyl-[acyl-carrier protein] reductase I
MLAESEQVSPLRRNVTIEDVGSSSLYLLSSLSGGTTGETIFVDGGYHAIGTGMKA